MNEPSLLTQAERPQVGLLSSEAVWRINSAPTKVSNLFEIARAEARDECLWLSAVCRQLILDNDALRIQVDKLNKQIDKFKADK